MPGLIRNLLTLVLAWFAPARSGQSRPVVVHFRVTPFDCGWRVLKSDRYLQLAEAAQLDFLARTGLLRAMLRRRVGFVNASLLVKLALPIGVFRRVRVETDIVFADGKCAYFSHAMFVGGKRHGEVLVKMKFKNGSITVPPAELIGQGFGAKPVHIERWDHALEVM